MVLKLTLQFDGTAYHGWQIQKNALTIQQIVSEAILRITGEQPSLIGCGRTDAGVHALGYIASFHTNTTIPPAKFPYALNSMLPRDIICKGAETVSDEFNARASALKKRYIYRIYNSTTPDAFEHRYSWHCRYALDLSAMREAAAYFLGEHDFAGFASSGFSVKTTIRTIYSLDISEDNNIITIDICGNGFLYNMVRIITGTLLFVGIGRISALEIPEIIASKQRDRAGITAPPQGLFLKEVYYA